jgi:hypothetical protein
MKYYDQLDMSQFDKILKDNASYFTDPNGNIDYNLVARFTIENIELFSDEKLFQEVAKDAINIFQLTVTPSELNPFSKENREKFLDIDGQYGGICVLSYDIDYVRKLYHKFRPYFEKNWFKHELVHFEKFIDLSQIKNVTYEQLMSHIDFGLEQMRNSADYRSVLEFSRNCCMFYESGDMGENGFGDDGSGSDETLRMPDWRPAMVLVVDALGAAAAAPAGVVAVVGGVVLSGFAAYTFYKK